MKLRRSQVVIVLLITAAIVIVFFAPSVDLEPTALRASQAASLIFLAIAAVSEVVMSVVPRMSRAFQFADSPEFLLGHQQDESLFELNCSRLC